MTRVVHCKREPWDVYIGRPSKWGNPFTHLPPSRTQRFTTIRVKTREDAIRQYEAWLLKQPHLLSSIHELRGKTLGCWCAPQSCHGHVLARLADEVTP